MNWKILIVVLESVWKWQMFGAWTRRLLTNTKQRVDPPKTLPNG